jgi:hypothetical protein
VSTTDIIEEIQKLSHADKVRLTHLLLDEIARPDLPPDDVIQRTLIMDAVHGPLSAENSAALMAALEAMKNGEGGV